MADVFQFLSSASLVKLTGRKAHNLEELLDLIRTCSDSSIFYHTFSAFLQMREVQVPYNTDFAVWASRSLNEQALAEKFMAVDLSEYNTIASLKTHLIEIIERYRDQEPDSFKKTANEPFYLYDMIRVVYRTDKFAYNLTSFREAIPTVSMYSIYYHFIESRLRTRLQDNDFSIWIEKSLNMPRLAHTIRKIDINLYTLEGLRSRIVQLIDQYLSETSGASQAHSGGKV